jgi:ATP-binding cassette subfamily B protein
MEKRINETVKQAELEETIAELKNGLDTPLGKIIENAQDISGGQWQRIAIGRSLISRAPVKMLDEPTAALDPIGESRVYEEFEKLMRGKTTVFISHRLGSTKLADDILVIDGGKVVERGRHEDLMGLNGQYAGMFEVQRSWYQ